MGIKLILRFQLEQHHQDVNQYKKNIRYLCNVKIVVGVVLVIKHVIENRSYQMGDSGENSLARLICNVLKKLLSFPVRVGLLLNTLEQLKIK